MKELYLKLLILLSEVQEFRFIEQDFGQLMAENPPLSYPAALLKINITGTDDYDSDFQRNDASIDVMMIYKGIGELNSITPEEQRNKALSYYDSMDKAHEKLQGYSDKMFDPFSRKSVTDQALRKGLKTVLHRYETSWMQDLYKPNDIAYMARYFKLFNSADLWSEGNVSFPPYNVYIPVKNIAYTQYDLESMRSNDKEKLFQNLLSNYIMLPEVYDDKKNPAAFNTSTNMFCCLYICVNGATTLKNSVKRTLKRKAKECVVFFPDFGMIESNIESLIRVIKWGKSKSIKLVTIICEKGVFSFTYDQILAGNISLSEEYQQKDKKKD